MNCRKFKRLQMKYFDRNLTGADQELLMRHLNSCERCRDCFTDLQEILGSLANSAPMGVTPHPDLQQRIMERLKQVPLIPTQPAKALRPKGAPVGSKFTQAPLWLLLLMSVTIGLSLRNTTLFDLVEPVGQIINRCFSAYTLLQSAWNIINRLFPVQVSGVMAQLQWISLLVIGTAFTLLVRNVVLKLKSNENEG